MVTPPFSSTVLGTLLAVTIALGGIGTVTARADTGKNWISVADNSGGSVASFVQHARSLQAAGTQVRFTGRCDSACTLLMALPARQTCIKPGAYFRFHAPISGDPRMARLTQRYMMMKYPSWVRSFIERRGGLTAQLVRMDYDYASRFMRSCGERT